MKERIELSENWKIKQEGIDSPWITAKCFPAQVQDILYQEKLLPEEFRVGWCREAIFIGKTDWLYQCEFQGEPGRNCRLIFEGLDTIADIYLNENYLGFHDDFYLPAIFDVTRYLKKDNVLNVKFKSPLRYMKKQEWDSRWDEGVLRCKTVRKPIHDFPPAQMEKGSNYQGAVPYFTPVGIYRNVYLEYYEQEEMLETDFKAKIEQDGRGTLKIEIKGKGMPEKVEVKLTWKNTGQVLETKTYVPFTKDDNWEIKDIFYLESPPLWNPRGFGKQNLCLVEAIVYKNHKCADKKIVTVGFRSIEMPKEFAFFINGKKIRLFGGSLDPMQGYTHCYDKDRASRLFQLVENANMNTLRIWGEGIPLPDEFYEECDKYGILVWQEFFLGHGAYPDSIKIKESCIKEAEVLIKRLRNHPCILLWCGGNETIMGAEFQRTKCFGSSIILQEFPKLIQHLDAARYYHPNSPWGGEWANDPREGDHHTYDCVWEYPYKDYPNFISEHIRTSPPILHSLKKMIHGPLWKASYTGEVSKPGEDIMPANWLERTHLGALAQRKTGAYWEYYDGDEPEDFIYAFGASYGKEIRRYAEQVRIGSHKPSDFLNRSKGYFACKLVDTWPKIYCAPIDFFQEVYIPYYTLKRAFEPICLCFQKEDSVCLWCVNDSPKHITKKVEWGFMDLETEKILAVNQKAVYVPQGEAEIVFDYAEYRFFSKNSILFARFLNEQDEEEYTVIDYVDIERHLNFKEPQLQVRFEKDYIFIKARHFARSVEILGKQGDDEFGWLFEDNYFDLLPGQERKIRILGNKTWGEIRIKPRYGDEQVFYWKGDGSFGENRFK